MLSVQPICIVYRNRSGEELTLVPCRYGDRIVMTADGEMKLSSRLVAVEANRIDGALAYLL